MRVQRSFVAGDFMENYICTLCPRNCHAERSHDTGKGYCKMGTNPRVARIAPHFWEEPCISGTKGSGAIFFSGCVLSCVFCQNYQISAECQGKELTVAELSDRIKELEQSGVHNINLVSPTPYVDSIVECFERYEPSIPIVYNTGGYEKAETLKKLEGIVDIYLPDVKYYDRSLSKKYSNAESYFEYASTALAEMVRQTGKPKFDDEGMMLQGTIVRHLVLPSNIQNSIKVLRWLNEHYAEDILVSIMGQYIPFGNAAKYPEINRKITTREYDKILDLLDTLDLDGFVQDLSSAKEDYIPTFDMHD